MTPSTTPDLFDLSERTVIITGGAGLLGEQHARAVAERNGIPVLLDVDRPRLERVSASLASDLGANPELFCGDITDSNFLNSVKSTLHQKFGRIDVLINNAALNPHVSEDSSIPLTRLEHFSLSNWEREINVGLTGAFLCSKVFGTVMSEQGRGVIVNVSSDLGLIAPDQRLYRIPNFPDHRQPTKPVTYSVIKHGLIGLTRYLSTYWADMGVRANALCPGGVQTNQPEDFVERLSGLIPLARMAQVGDYKGAIQFLCSDASAYMNGACLTIDGGRSAW
jgi:NAD(P)-dependent dehydrogenase (short-subunit alcohol dehydrogenase family)